MYFKKLEIHGFKSFFDKTTLNFEPGITAVVGPNGCGKSNIFDAIRWVLGEQSAKSLRGSEMQDVIFNGTDTKESLGMAEVSLAFDNEKRFFNFDNDEVMITRRLFRSGESEYLLNKSPVRLKDILDLLLGTGIGAESYSIIAQGKIDMVLSSRPEDRRLVFDEASGITKYKAQKRETARKLEETEQNLLRVNDIITEVKRQIGSLERQAAKARRYKEAFDELKQKELSQALLQKDELSKKKNEVALQLKELEGKEAEYVMLVREQEAKIANRQMELGKLEEAIYTVKNEIMNLENQGIRSRERITFNREKLTELDADNKFLTEQSEQLKIRLVQDEEKLNNLQLEYDNIKKLVDEKRSLLIAQENEIQGLDTAIRHAQEEISRLKATLLELALRIANAKNEVSDTSAKEQIYLARKKRLDIEKAKAYEERCITEDSLNKITSEVEALKSALEGLKLNILREKEELEKESLSLSQVNEKSSNCERQKVSLESHKQFLEKLKSEYEEIGESMNAVIYLDKLPAGELSGLVVKLKDKLKLNDEDKAYFEPANFKVQGEAKPIELDTSHIEEKIMQLEEELKSLQSERSGLEAKIDLHNKNILSLVDEERNQEIILANKDASLQKILEQFNKIKEEEDVVVLELQDVQKELGVLQQNAEVLKQRLADLNKEQLNAQDGIIRNEQVIAQDAKKREVLLIALTQAKTELDNFNQRLESEVSTLKLLEDTFNQDKEQHENMLKQLSDNSLKQEALKTDTIASEEKIIQLDKQISSQKSLLQEEQAKYALAQEGANEVIGKIESERKELDAIKSKLYETQMLDKETDYKYSSIKERMLQAYKIDLEATAEIAPGLDSQALLNEIEALKQKLDSYGTVNLVAIEEYDELKKRYDFLVQQQTDLVTAKESLHEAILKINRTTKQMFLETFERVREEFRNYFRVLFNGGDAQVYLTDEQDPLESGIEIICRPPGKKLQNVLLLSGGEKSMSAIALIFAIFKVKPSPFCILDEIDAALDEANVDRFGRMLLEFTKQSQFIVITHNKKTIINANVMYGITMQESGVSKIVSVKFSGNKAEQEKDKEPDAAVAEPV